MNFSTENIIQPPASDQQNTTTTTTPQYYYSASSTESLLSTDSSGNQDNDITDNRIILNYALSARNGVENADVLVASNGMLPPRRYLWCDGLATRPALCKGASANEAGNIVARNILRQSLQSAHIMAHFINIRPFAEAIREAVSLRPTTVACVILYKVLSHPLVAGHAAPMSIPDEQSIGAWVHYFRVAFDIPADETPFTTSYPSLPITPGPAGQLTIPGLPGLSTSATARDPGTSNLILRLEDGLRKLSPVQKESTRRGIIQIGIDSIARMFGGWRSGASSATGTPSLIQPSRFENTSGGRENLVLLSTRTAETEVLDIAFWVKEFKEVVGPAVPEADLLNLALRVEGKLRTSIKRPRDSVAVVL